MITRNSIYGLNDNKIPHVCMLSFSLKSLKDLVHIVVFLTSSNIDSQLENAICLFGLVGVEVLKLRKELIERNGHVKMPIKAFDNRQLSIPKGQK